MRDTVRLVPQDETVLSKQDERGDCPQHVRGMSPSQDGMQDREWRRNQPGGGYGCEDETSRMCRGDVGWIA